MLNQSNNFQNNLFSNQPNVKHENPLSLGDTNEPEEVANFDAGGLAMEEPVPFELSKKEKIAKVFKALDGKDNLVSMILSRKGRNERVNKQKAFNDLKAKNALQEKTEMQNRFLSLENNLQNLTRQLENRQSSVQQPIIQSAGSNEVPLAEPIKPLRNTNELENVNKFNRGGLSKGEKASIALGALSGWSPVLLPVSIGLGVAGRKKRLKKLNEMNALKEKKALDENNISALERNVPSQVPPIQQKTTEPVITKATSLLDPIKEQSVPTPTLAPTSINSSSSTPSTIPYEQDVDAPAKYFKGGRIDGIAKRGRTRCRIL